MAYSSVSWNTKRTKLILVVHQARIRVLSLAVAAKSPTFSNQKCLHADSPIVLLQNMPVRINTFEMPEKRADLA